MVVNPSVSQLVGSIASVLSSVSQTKLYQMCKMPVSSQTALIRFLGGSSMSVSGPNLEESFLRDDVTTTTDLLASP